MSSITFTSYLLILFAAGFSASLAKAEVVSGGQEGNATRSDFFFGQTRQSGGCVYSHKFSNVGESIFLNSENYPNNYWNNLDCRYTLSSPEGTQMVFQCDDFRVEPATNCGKDIFFWSLSGDPYFSDWQYACGTPSLSQKKSYANQLTMGFRSDGSNPAGTWRYRCKIDVVPTPCNCGTSGAMNTKIVGGTEAQIAEFPWRVALFTSRSGLFCGGSLIHNNWVLTAAHCTASLEEGETIYADIGDHDLRSTSDSNNQVIEVPFTGIIQNSLYNPDTKENDLSLLRLSRPVQYAKNIQPLCLPWKFTSTNFDRKVATASGWGTTFYGGSQSDKLLKVDLDVQNSQTCSNNYASRKVPITNNMICAYREGKDTCQSDSGGSLDYRDPSTGNFYGIGVTSFGFGCAQKDTPGIYAQLVNYLGWIEQNTRETYCKA